MAEPTPHRKSLHELSALVLAGKREADPDSMRGLREAGAEAMTVLRAGLMRAVRKGSALYEAKRCHLPAVLFLVGAFYQGFHELETELATCGQGGPLVALGTVQGDFHEIGKNLVGIMLQANGIPVLDLG